MPLPDAKTLHQLYVVEGLSVRLIARRQSCRTAAVLAGLRAAGIARRRPGRPRAPLPDWDRAKLQQLVRAQGMVYVREFARRHGLSREKLAVLLGAQPLGRGQLSRYTVLAHDAEIRQAYDAGASVKSLAARYGCTRRAIGYSLDRTSGTNAQPNLLARR